MKGEVMVKYKHRAKIAILNHILVFCNSKNYGNNINRGGFGNNYFFPSDNPQKGDLITLDSAPISKWYLSWYRDFIPENSKHGATHVLESIEDGELCNWQNVSFYILNREVTREHPEWLWTNKQFEFWDRWKKVSGKYYISFCLYGGFIDFNDNRVTLRIRKNSLSKEAYYYTKEFNNWKKVTIEDMELFWDDILNKFHKHLNIKRNSKLKAGGEEVKKR
jgi:hypothetical protein